MANRYDVRPFSGEKYHANSDRCESDETPCAICGRGVKDPWPHTAIVIDGGETWGDENSDAGDAGYMGGWPVGSDCHRRHLVEVKMTQPHFVVDKQGLAKLLERRSKAYILFELLQNAWDENTTHVEATVEWLGERTVRITMTDDAPEGFADLTHAYTLFAESAKKSDPTKRGRFNLGEKLVIAASTSARITTTKGTVEFERDGRTNRRRTREYGTEFRATFRMSKAEYETMLAEARTAICPANVETIINGEPLPHREPVATILAPLPTEVADAEGYLRPTVRGTVLRLYEPLPGEAPTLYEMGIPVVETSQRWHIDIGQKVPLNSDRDNVTPAYMRQVNVLVANEMYVYLLNSKEAATEDWVTEALAHAQVNPETVDAVLHARFGDKRVINDPSDPEGTKMAVAAGYTVIPGGAFSGAAWAHIKEGGHALPAGRVTPSPKAYSDSPDAKPLNVIGPDRWTQGMATFVGLAVDVARVVLYRKVQVRFVSDITWPFAATYGPDGVLTVNVGRLGHAWFGAEKQRQLALLLHEFVHEQVSDHLSRDFADGVADLGARLALAVAKGEVKL